MDPSSIVVPMQPIIAVSIFSSIPSFPGNLERVRRAALLLGQGLYEGFRGSFHSARYRCRTYIVLQAALAQVWAHSRGGPPVSILRLLAFQHLP